VSNENLKSVAEIVLDREGLFREETYTDLKAGSIQVLTPVKEDGTVDDSRTPLFMGEAHLMSPSGPLPVRCEIEAKNLVEALDKFPAAVNAAVDRMIAQVQELERQEAGRIITPDEIGGGRKIIS
jgi:hypothetical protein